MKARYKYRFYPTDQQRTSLAQLFGCVRVVWNDALALCKQSEKLPSNGDLQKLVLTQSKKTEQRSWLSSVASIALQQSVADLGTAYKNFFDSLKGKRKGKKLGSPRFKKKTNQQSARLTRGGFSISKEVVYLAKIGNVAPIWSRQLPCEPSSVTIIKDCANRYFLSFVVDIEPVSLDTKSQTRRSCVANAGAIGIDLGIKTFAVMSNGEKAESPSYKKLDRKIRQLQKKLARQHKNSKRRDKTRIQIAKRHNQIADTRRDFLHKLSTKIVSENQAIVLEDLNVSGMVKNRKLSRVISLQGWREFRTQCEAKSAKYDRTFHVISRWEPTSQVCSECGFKWGKLDLKVRQIKCLNCGTEHERDGNAAKNIEKVGIGHCHDSKCTSRRSKPTSVVSVNEA
ncbi:MAG: RNA-guided endonuclease InsQ/TnpB family protein [Gloeotrichia echinulata HAB0833]